MSADLLYDAPALYTTHTDANGPGQQQTTLNAAELNQLTQGLASIRNTFQEPHFFIQGASVPGAIVAAIVFARSFVVDVNFGVGQGAGTGGAHAADSQGNVLGTLPAATTTYTVKKRTAGGALSTIGTIVVSAAGAFTFTASAKVTFAAGDALFIVAPNPTDVLSDWLVIICAKSGSSQNA